MTKPPMPKMDELLQRLLDDRIELEDMERLQKAIHDNPQVRDYYLDSMLTNAMLRRASQPTGEFTTPELVQAVWDDRSQNKREPRVVQVLASLAAMLILGVLIITAVHYSRRQVKGPVVGSVGGIYEVQWRGEQPNFGGPLYAGSYCLLEGAAQLDLKLGVRLLLEAPCRIELTSLDEMTLESGRLTVAVAPEATGFRVKTKTALITDLGTEFGVVAHDNGSMEAHVFKGSVKIALATNNTMASPASRIVKEGSAAEVDVTRRAIRGGLVAKAQSFLLQLPLPSHTSGLSKYINLADIVGGGNGHDTGRLEQGIDLETGLAFSSSPTDIKWMRQNIFQITPELDGIDGVFVPNKALGRVIVSSTGLVFSKCPETHGSYYTGPTNSGMFRELVSKKDYTSRLMGVSYGTRKHPALRLHPNAGITFDLERLRQKNPGFVFNSFTAICGISRELPQSRFSSADVWILIDGVMKVHHHYPIDQNFAKHVEVEISPKDRFLTLVATCSGRADYSWMIFGEPFLGGGNVDMEGVTGNP